MSTEIDRLEAVAAVVSHAGRVRWLRPELCEVGDQLCRLTDAQAIIAQRDARIAELEQKGEYASKNYARVTQRLVELTDKESEQAQEIERLNSYKRFESLYAESERELAALKKLLERAHGRMDELKAQPSAGVVLPERANENEGNSYSVMQAMARNQTIDEVARLNPCCAQAVAVEHNKPLCKHGCGQVAVYSFIGECDECHAKTLSKQLGLPAPQKESGQ